MIPYGRQHISALEINAATDEQKSFYKIFKTKFLAGEYLALYGGPALVAVTEPRFQLKIEKSAKPTKYFLNVVIYELLFCLIHSFTDEMSTCRKLLFALNKLLATTINLLILIMVF